MPLIHPKRMQKSTRFQSRIRFCFIFFSIHFNHLLFMRNTVPRPAYYWPARRGPLREEKKKRQAGGSRSKKNPGRSTPEQPETTTTTMHAPMPQPHTHAAFFLRQASRPHPPAPAHRTSGGIIPGHAGPSVCGERALRDSTPQRDASRTSPRPHQPRAAAAPRHARHDHPPRTGPVVDHHPCCRYEEIRQAGRGGGGARARRNGRTTTRACVAVAVADPEPVSRRAPAAGRSRGARDSEGRACVCARLLPVRAFSSRFPETCGGVFLSRARRVAAAGFWWC